LSDTEVIAALLGGKPGAALETARNLLLKHGGIQGLLRASLVELTQEAGIGPARAATLKAALELGRRLLLVPPEERPQVRSPDDVATLLMVEMGHLEQEQLRVLLLNTRHHVVRQVVVYTGNVNTSLVRVGEIFREAVRDNAAAVIVAHNHPSSATGGGSVEASPEDVAITKEIVAAGKLMDISVLDHLIIGCGHYVSMRERGLGFGSS
jgi:DNA repair protein RadC